MFSAKSCPHCGGILRFEDARGDFSPARFLAVELAFWAALVFGLAFLYAPAGGGMLALGLSVIAAGTWLKLRPHQREQSLELLERREYFCPQCRHRYVGNGLTEIASH